MEVLTIDEFPAYWYVFMIKAPSLWRFPCWSLKSCYNLAPLNLLHVTFTVLLAELLSIHSYLPI